MDRFDVNFETKILVKLSKLLKQPEEQQKEEDIVLKDFVGVMGMGDVVMVSGKTEKAKRVLSRFYLKDERKPELDYKTDKIPSCKYSVDLLKNIMDFFDVFDDSVRITLKEDYPATIENDGFCVYIAP